MRADPEEVIRVVLGRCYPAGGSTHEACTAYVRCRRGHVLATPGFAELGARFPKEPLAPCPRCAALLRSRQGKLAEDDHIGQQADGDVNQGDGVPA